MESPAVAFPSAFEIVYCYGLLYHLRDPTAALAYMSRYCSGTQSSRPIRQQPFCLFARE